MAVIAVVSIISGLNDYVAGKIFNLGPDVLTVSRTSPVISSFDDWIENQKRNDQSGEEKTDTSMSLETLIAIGLFGWIALSMALMGLGVW